MEAHPWLRPYLKERLERQIALFLEEANALRANGLRHLVRRWRAVAAEGSLSGFMTPEQRGLMRETQLVMSLLEGFSDWVMDEVGDQVLPDVRGIRRRFEARRAQRRKGLDRIVGRLTGLDLKMEQYRRGERFVAGVWKAGGDAAIAHLWDGPAALPTEAEMEDPAAWVRRVVPDALAVARPYGRRPAAQAGPPRRGPARLLVPPAPRDRRDHGERSRRLMAGTGPGGVPTAIALTPILSARYREADLERIRAAAPASRIVSMSLEGLTDGTSTTSRSCCADRCRPPPSTACWRAARACAGCTRPPRAWSAC